MKIGNNFAFSKVKNLEYSNVLESATVQGIGYKTLGLLFTTLATAMLLIGIIVRMESLPILSYVVATISIVVFQIIMIFNPASAKKLAFPYAISEGLTIGCLCGLLELALPEMGLQIAGLALMITLSIFAAAILLYTKGIIKVGLQFRAFVFSFTLGFGIFMLTFSLMALVFMLTSRVNLFSYFYFSNLSIVICIISCFLASLYVVLTIARVDEMIEAGIDRKYEWYAAYAILLNVIYLFLEVLRLLIVLASRNRRN